MDRNQRARAEHMSGQARAMRQQFAQAFAAGQVHVKDRFGRNVALNDLVIYNPPQPLVFQVTALDPVLDPNQPPGLLRVNLNIDVPIIWQAGYSASELVVVGAVREAGHSEINATRPTDAADPPLQETAGGAQEDAAAGDQGPAPPTFVTKPEDDPSGGGDGGGDGGVH